MRTDARSRPITAPRCRLLSVSMRTFNVPGIQKNEYKHAAEEYFLIFQPELLSAAPEVGGTTDLVCDEQVTDEGPKTGKNAFNGKKNNNE